jgi:hypothetical protein
VFRQMAARSASRDSGRSPPRTETGRDSQDARHMTHNPSMTGKVSMRQYRARNETQPSIVTGGLAAHYEWRAACLRTRYLHR